jgi:Cof subfamily protein (haloacid dehalogenase superfamily)
MYAVFLDIDGTIMNNGIIPQRNIDVITSVQQLGHKVFINTGRSYASIPRELLDAVHFDGIVAGMGSYIRLGDEIVKSVVIPGNILKEIADYFVSKDMLCIFEGEEKMLYMNVNNEEDKLIVKDGNDFFTVYKEVRISKVTVGGVLTHNAVKLLEKNFTVIQHKMYAEFALKGCSKANGMKAMLERLSLKRENSIAVGDSANDIDMLEYAGISVAMGNSSAEVKQLCDFVSETVDNAGVAAALEKYVLSA